MFIFNTELRDPSTIDAEEYVRYFRKDLEYFIRKAMVALDATEENKGNKENDQKFLDLMFQNIAGISESYERAHDTLFKPE